MSWKFIETGKNSTKIINRYQVSGTINGGMNSLADAVDSVQYKQVTALIERLKSSHEH